MSGDYLLDTNVFINAIKRQLCLPPAHYAYSVITELELLGFPGLPLQEEQAISALLANLTRVELNHLVKQETINTRRHTLMKLPDSIISASATVTQTTLVTDDATLAARHPGKAISLNMLLRS